MCITTCTMYTFCYTGGMNTDDLREKIDTLLVTHNQYIDDVWRGRANLDNPPRTAQGFLELIKLQQEALLDRTIKYIRSGKVAGSFSEGCDCEKCDAYEKKVRAELRKQLR